MSDVDIRNALGVGFIVAAVLWAANKGYEVGFKNGRRFEKMANDYAEKTKKDFNDRFYKAYTGR